MVKGPDASWPTYTSNEVTAIVSNMNSTSTSRRVAPVPNSQI